MIKSVLAKFILAFFASSNLCLASADPNFSTHTLSMAEVLKQNNFLCKANADVSGFRCRGKIPAYPMAINIFFPSSLSTWPDILNLHFHGHTNCPTPECHFDIASGNGDYAKMLAERSHRSVLIIPESIGKVSTYRQYFTSEEKLNIFLDSIRILLKMDRLSRMRVSSHSGGDVMIERISTWGLARNPSDHDSYFDVIQSVGLFDSLYAPRVAILKWSQKKHLASSDFRFFGSYVVGPEASTTKYMQWLQQELPASSEVQYTAVRCQHMQIMKLGGMSEFFAD